MRTTPSTLEIARTLALKAAARIMELRKSPLVQDHKADHSLVTNADHEADRILREGLRKAFPEHSILTEESGLEGPVKAEYQWVIDPIDGTRAYANGVPGFSVMVGLLKRDQPYMGVVVDPSEGLVYEAERGEGAWCSKVESTEEPVRILVSKRTDLNAMPVTTSTGFPESLQVPIKKKLQGPWLPAINSVGIKVGLIVRQKADIYINHHGVHFWDTCAPQIILEEAGGIFTYIDGSSLDYSFGEGHHRHPKPTLATNGSRHQEILDVLRSSMPRLSS